MSGSQEIRDFWLMLRRRKRPSGTFATMTILAAVSFAVLLPAEYRSTAVLLFEEPGVSEDYVKSSVATIDRRPMDSSLEMDRISRAVLTREELIDVVRQIDPYPKQSGMTESEKALRIERDTEIEQIDPITQEASEDFPAYAIHYLNPDPDIAAEICSALVQLFTERSLEIRTELAHETYEFLETEASRLRDEVTEAEDRLASFKRQFGDALPGSQRSNRDALERAEARLIEINRQMRAADDRLASVRFEKAGISPTVGNARPNVSVELAELERALAEARQKYTDDHPDVKRLVNAINNLKPQLQNLPRSSGGNNQAVESYPGMDIDVQPDNPAYIELLNQEKAIERDIEALKAQEANTRRDVSEFRSSLQDAPEAEQKYLALSRDYEIAQEKYKEIRRAQASAELAISLEAKQRGQRISVIQAALTPQDPYSPHRVGILMLGIFISLAGGIALAAILDMLDGTVRGSNDLYEIVQLPPLATVPHMASSLDRKRRRFRTFLLFLLLLAIVAAGMNYGNLMQ